MARSSPVSPRTRPPTWTTAGSWCPAATRRRWPRSTTPGNTKVIGAQTHFWDGADRHMRTQVNGGATVSYKRDATGRIVERTEGSSVVRYGHSGPGDSPSFTMTNQNALIDRHVGLMGGVIVTRNAGETWDYPNTHGDILVSANASGLKTGPTGS